MNDLVLVYDMDDTLYPEREYVVSALLSLSTHVKESFGVSEFGETAVEFFEKGDRGDLFQKAFRALGVTHFSEESVRNLIDIYRNHKPETLSWYPDAHQFVTSRKNLYPTALITDGYMPTQRLKAEALGLAELIDHLVFTEELGRENWKPSPRPYQTVQDFFGPNFLYIYIADNPTKDFYSPNRMGWKTIRIRRKGTESFEKESSGDFSPQYEITSFEGIGELLADLKSPQIINT